MWPVDLVTGDSVCIRETPGLSERVGIDDCWRLYHFLDIIAVKERSIILITGLRNSKI